MICNLKKKIVKIFSILFNSKPYTKKNESIKVEIKSTIKGKMTTLNIELYKNGSNETSLNDVKKIQNEDLLQLYTLFMYFEENNFISQNYKDFQNELFGKVDKDFFITSCEPLTDFLDVDVANKINLKIKNKMRRNKKNRYKRQKITAKI